MKFHDSVMNHLCDKCQENVKALDVDDVADLIEDLNDAFDGEFLLEDDVTLLPEEDQPNPGQDDS